MKLLLVEDEAMLSKSVSKGLRLLGYAIDCAFDGEEALELYALNEYDLMILDLNLPKLDGIEVLKRIREKDQDFRILILSARNSLEDKINGLDSGKPFDFMELEARIRNLLRRNFKTDSRFLLCGRLRLDTGERQAQYAGQTVVLTRKEYALLEYLFSRLGETVSAEELIEHAWDSETDLFSNSFRFHIHSLRKKLEAAGAGEYIVTKRGQGYILRCPAEDES